VFDTCLAYPCAAAAVGVKAPAKGGVVRNKGVARLVLFIGVVAGEWCSAAVIGTVEEATAGASAKLLGVSKLFRDVLVCERCDYRWRGCVAKESL
jgi:hypothetical protein